MKYNEHNRYYEIFGDKNVMCCGDLHENTLKIILFKDKYKLRSHTLKHYMNLEEKDFDQKKNVIKAIDLLKTIQCPGINKTKPYCKNCHLFKTCSDILSTIEEEYVKNIRQIIENSLCVPRYVCYHSKDENNTCLTMIPRQKFIVKASLLKNSIFNLSTCYNISTNQQFNEMFQEESIVVKEEAKNRSITWCNELTWGIEKHIQVPLERQKKSKNVKKKKRKIPYFSKGGAKSKWQYLDDYYDDKDHCYGDME